MKKLLLSFFVACLTIFSATAATITVTQITDDATGTTSGSLSWALNTAAEGDVIAFNLATGDVVTLSAALSDIDKSLTMEGINIATGNRVTIQVASPGVSTYRVFVIISAAVKTITLNDLILRGGNVPTANGGVVYSGSGFLNLNRCVIRDGKSSGGGGIFVQSPMIMNQCTVTDNSADGGAGVYINNNGCTIINSTITANVANSSGGGVYISNGRTCNIINTTISGNAGSGGGGVYAFNLTGSTLCLALNSIFINNTGYDFGTSRLAFSYGYYSWKSTGTAWKGTNASAPNKSNSYTAGDLGSLGNNGGATPTMQLSATAPAYQTGSYAYYNATDGYYYKGTNGSYYKLATTVAAFTPVTANPETDKITTDQRGATRDATPSMGAYDGTIANPEIDLKQATTPIADGTGTYDFGSQATSTNTDVVFTIENTGTATSTLGDFTITGTDASLFSFQGDNPTTVANGSSATFTVRFAPTSGGAKTATVSFANQDENENPYNFTVTGTGVVPGYTISGKAGVAGATLSYTDGTAKTATANGSGNYSFTVSGGWSGTVTPSKTSYTFSPTHKEYTNVTVNQTAQDYSATGSFTWTGAISTDWNDAGNWDLGSVPTGGDIVTVPNVANKPLTDKITVSTGGSMTIEANGLVSANSLENNGTVHIRSNISGTGSLIMGGAATGPGNALVERFMPEGEWHIISSPTGSQKINDFIADNLAIPSLSGTSPVQYGMMDYNTGENKWNTYFTAANTSELGIGKGYMVRVKNAVDNLRFQGVINGDASTAVLAGWNCIGNPFTSAINVNTKAGATNFMDFNWTKFDDNNKALYLWNQTNNLGAGSYDVVNLADDAAYAQVGQGFFMKAKADGTVSFTTAMQSHQITAPFKSSAAPWPKIKLVATANNRTVSTDIKFIEGTQKGLDPGYDAGLFTTDKSFSIYTKLVEDNGVNFQLQCLPPSGYDKMVIPVGIDCKAGGEIVFTVKAVQLDPTCKVILEDKLTNTFTDLSKWSYKASIVADTKGADRFFLHTGDIISGLEDQVLPGTVTAYAIGNTEIRVLGEVGEGAVATLVNGLGQVVLTKTLGAGSLNIIGLPNLSSGLYLLNIIDKGTAQTIKIMIRK